MTIGDLVIENQGVAFTLANMKMEIDAARLLVWRASWMARNGIPFENAEGSMSKLKAGEVAVWATERAIQILGGNGYTRTGQGALVEMIYREVPGARIPGGSEDVLLDLGVRQLVKLYKAKTQALEAASKL